MTRKPLFFMLTFFFILLACSSSDSEPEASESLVSESSINRIMPLGASRVQGARPLFESYRYELWKDLIDGGWTFDYIGTQQDHGDYESYNGQSFDTDHEGRGGWTSGQILSGISDWLTETGAPDIVLFSSPGGNDGLQDLPYDDIIPNINAIIDALQAVNPNVTIIIELMAPPTTEETTPELSTYLEQMQEDIPIIALEKSTTTSQIIVVDMFTGFSDDLLADDVHYNEAGARFIAERYYAVLVDVLVQQ